MKIYSNTLDREDLFKTCPPSCELEVITIAHPRKATHAWQVRLTCPSGRYWTNSGQFGSGPVKAASWDQWGIWFEDMFAIDSDAIIGQYSGHDNFVEMTSRYTPKGMKAPWLYDKVTT